MIIKIKMRKRKRYITLAVIVSILLFCISGSMLAVSCNSTVPTIPIELSPAYNIDIPSTPETVTKKEPSDTVAVVRGSSVTVPVTVTSMSGVPIKIRLVLTPELSLPSSITFKIQQEYVTIEPGKSINIPVTITAAESTLPGTFGMSVFGSLKEPVKGRSLSAQIFMLVIIDSQS
jgi:hypothetical protein